MSRNNVFINFGQKLLCQDLNRMDDLLNKALVLLVRGAMDLETGQGQDPILDAELGQQMDAALGAGLALDEAPGVAPEIIKI